MASLPQAPPSAAAAPAIRPTPPAIHGVRSRRRPSGEPPPLPRHLNASGKWWLALSGLVLVAWAVVVALLFLPLLERRGWVYALNLVALVALLGVFGYASFRPGQREAVESTTQRLLRLGLPILSYPLLGWWGARCTRVRRPEESTR